MTPKVAFSRPATGQNGSDAHDRLVCGRCLLAAAVVGAVLLAAMALGAARIAGAF